MVEGMTLGAREWGGDLAHVLPRLKTLGALVEVCYHPENISLICVSNMRSIHAGCRSFLDWASMLGKILVERARRGMLLPLEKTAWAERRVKRENISIKALLT